MNQLKQQDIYVMRLWHEPSSHKQGSNKQGSNKQEHDDAWRVTITDTKNKQKHHFASFEALLAFFKERLEMESEQDL